MQLKSKRLLKAPGHYSKTGEYVSFFNNTMKNLKNGRSGLKDSIRNQIENIYSNYLKEPSCLDRADFQNLQQ